MTNRQLQVKLCQDIIAGHYDLTMLPIRNFPAYMGNPSLARLRNMVFHIKRGTFVEKDDIRENWRLTRNLERKWEVSQDVTSCADST